MPGQGFSMTRQPPSFVFAGLPSSFRTFGTMPKNGLVAEPGFKVVAPGRADMSMPPVSVCHHVSTTGSLLLPTTEWYHIHASGFMGSPTEPRTRRLVRSCFSTQPAPHLMSALMAVGAV